MAKKKMFKQTSTLHLENLSDSGNWNSFADILKQQDQFTSAYVEKVRISFLQTEAMSYGGQFYPLGWNPVMFGAATAETLDNSSADSEYLIASAASRGGGGTVTLNLDRRIVLNQIDPESGEAAIRLFIKCPDISTAVGDMKATLIIETWGRWHTVEAL